MKLTLGALGLATLSLVGCATSSTIPYTVTTHVRSTPDTVVMGHLPDNRKPVATVKSGDVVRIDTISHQGLNSGMDPVKFFASAGIPANEVLKDASDVYPMVGKRPKGAGAHVLTGPIYIE